MEYSSLRAHKLVHVRYICINKVHQMVSVTLRLFSIHVKKKTEKI